MESLKTYNISLCRIADSPRDRLPTPFGTVVSWPCEMIDGENALLLTVPENASSEFRMNDLAGVIMADEGMFPDLSQEFVETLAMGYVYGLSVGVYRRNGDDRGVLGTLQRVTNDHRGSMRST